MKSLDAMAKLGSGKHRLRQLFASFGYEVSKVRAHEFTQDGIVYRTDPCSTGRTPEGQWAAEGAVRMIRASGRRHLAILDLCCGVGNVGLAIWSQLRDAPGVVSSLAFADINIFNLHSVRRTLRENRIDEAPGHRFETYLSDGMSQIPRGRVFDLIVANPPHYDAADTGGVISSARLSTVDVGWSFHARFYQEAHQWLRDGGQTWLFENSAASRPEASMDLIGGNAELTFLRTLPEPSAPRFFWVMAERRPRT